MWTTSEKGLMVSLLAGNNATIRFSIYLLFTYWWCQYFCLHSFKDLDNELKSCVRKQLRYNSRHYPGTCLQGLWKTTEMSIRIVSIPPKVQSSCVSNTIVKCYHLSQLAQHLLCSKTPGPLSSSISKLTIWALTNIYAESILVDMLEYFY